ncbi:hypothetical protein IEO21_09389 [Rhodonia placenta]|uniref:Uncharacterized protein n=1 Tax=Rhodonia placenta TaxID=104341 RepID=A0A8H7NRU9_9APHY|nr:hypothetical protein IEO21_10813 [Postia placenta]KAF9804460.1 hypothetical protein IEO21_09389 [Postia placenta]
MAPSIKTEASWR